MRAIILKEFVKRTPIIQVQKIPFPVLEKGQILIKVQASPINPSDLGFIQQNYYRNPSPPCGLGFQASGTVVWSENTELVGKKVSVLAIEGGAWAEFVKVKTEHVFLMKEGVSFSEAASILNPFTVFAFGEIIKERGGGVLQTAAASSLGKMLTAQCEQRGVSLINIVRKQQQVSQIGGKVVLNSSSHKFLDQLKESCGELGVKVGFDAVAGNLTGLLVDCIQPEGTVFVYGKLSLRPLGAVRSQNLLYGDKEIKGFHLENWWKKQRDETVRKMVWEVSQKIDGIYRSSISREVGLESFQEAFQEYKENMSRGKLIFNPNL